MTSRADGFKVDERVTLLPVVHGSGPYARAVEDWLLAHDVDCLAVPLPPSFGETVCHAVQQLPTASIVIQKPSTPAFRVSAADEQEWSESEDDTDRDNDRESPWSYVPIEPCQSVIAALRFALGEHLPIRFVDQEVDVFEETGHVFPDPFALRELPIESFAAAVLPAIEKPKGAQLDNRIRHMAGRLRELAQTHQNVVMLCSIEHWPWLRQAYLKGDAEEIC